MEQGEHYEFKCFKCGRFGGPIEAVMQRDGVTHAAATRIVEASLGVRLTRDENPAPVLRPDAEARVQQWHDALVGDIDAVERCKIPFVRVIQHKIGFASRYNHLATWTVDGIVVPIYVNGNLAAVRLLVSKHYIDTRPQRPLPKALWVLEKDAPAQGIMAWFPNLDGDLTVQPDLMAALVKGGIAATCDLDKTNGVMQRQLQEAKDRGIQAKLLNMVTFWERGSETWELMRNKWVIIPKGGMNAVNMLYERKYGELSGNDLRLAVEFLERVKVTYG